MKISTLAAVTAAFAVCAVAGAQSAPLGASVRLGGFLPTNTDTSDATSNAFFAFGVDYTLTYKPPTVGGYKSSSTISVDYFRKNDFGSIPVLLNYVITKDRLSFSAGVGVAFTSLPGSEDSKFGYQVGVAYDLPFESSTPIFIAAKFLGTEQNKLNGVGVYLGVKF